MSPISCRSPLNRAEYCLLHCLFDALSCCCFTTRSLPSWLGSCEKQCKHATPGLLSLEQRNLAYSVTRSECNTSIATANCLHFLKPTVFAESSGFSLPFVLSMVGRVCLPDAWNSEVSGQSNFFDRLWQKTVFPGDQHEGNWLHGNFMQTSTTLPSIIQNWDITWPWHNNLAIDIQGKITSC